MRNGFGIKYIDDDNYSIGYFKDDKLDGWGAVVVRNDKEDYIQRGIFKDDTLNGIGIVCYYNEEGAKEEVGFFENGVHLSFEEVKTKLKANNYKWMPDYNGDYDYYDVIYYGYLAEDGYPRGSGMIELDNQYYFIYYDEEGYRSGLFFFPMENGLYTEHLYIPRNNRESKKEMMYIRIAGLYLKPKKMLKKYKDNI